MDDFSVTFEMCRQFLPANNHYVTRIISRNLKVFSTPLQDGEQLVKKIGGVFAFKVKDGPGGKEATWVVDVKNGKGSVSNDPGMYLKGGVLTLLSKPNNYT